MTPVKPLVSIVITSYNYGRYIGQTISSVLAQTYENWELIISDDGSTDNSLEVIRSFVDERITVIASATNEGGGVAYRKAYALCRGKYFCSLDSDDYISPDKIEKQVSYLEDHPDVDILGTFVTEIDPDGQPPAGGLQHEIWFNQDLDLNQPDSWLRQNRLCHSSVLMRKSLHDRIGQPNNDLPNTGDYEFWLRCLIGGAGFHVLPEKLTYYRFHGGNVTHKDPDRLFGEYVYIFCTHIKPYLLRINRYDLLNETIAVLLSFNESYQKAAPNLKANVIENLLSIENEHRGFQSFLEDMQSPAGVESRITTGVIDSVLSKYQQQQAWTAELEQGKAWLEKQWQHWQRIAKEREQIIQEWRAWITELGQGKAWLEEQWRNWQRIVEEREATIRRQDEYLTKLRLNPLIRLAIRLGFLRLNDDEG